MKFSLTCALALAPLALASRFHNFSPRGNHQQSDNKHTIVAEGNGGKGRGNSATRTEIIIIWANPGNGAETTTLHEKVTVTQTVTAGAGATKVVGGDGAITTIKDGQTATAPAAGASHTVTVGGPAGLVFTPDQLNNVPIGDFVVFEFLSQNHTVTQSPFDTPCDALPDGMDTGFMANPNNTVSPPPQVAMQVMVDKPLWFYCKQGNHCGKGMVFSINPTADKTQAMFQQKAIEQKGDGKSTPITGGQPNAPAESPAASSSAAQAPPAAGSSAVQAPPAATSSASVPEGTGPTPGKGTVGADGSCSCVVVCAAGSFPVQAQGAGSFGGQGGGLPMNMVGLS